MTYSLWISRLLIAVAIIAAPAAFADTSFSIVAAPTYTMTGSGWTGGLAPLGGGLLLEFGGPKVGFELGGLYVSRAYSTTTTYSCAEGLATLNFKLSPKFHIALGGYYDSSLSVTGPAAPGVTTPFSDYGAMGGVGFGFGHVRLDVQYQYALKAVATGVNMNQIQALIGFRFGGKQ